MISGCVRALVLAVVALSSAVQASAAPVTLDATSATGWYYGGVSSSEPFSGFQCFADFGGCAEYNSLFVFDLGPVEGEVTSAMLELTLTGYDSADAWETLSLYDVSAECISFPEFCGIDDDLGGGQIYGSSFVDSSDVGSVLQFVLSGPALADINAVSGGLFGIGAHLESPYCCDDFVDGCKELVYFFDRAGVGASHQLILEVAPAPEPSAALCFGLGIGAAAFATRRRPSRSSPRRALAI